MIFRASSVGKIMASPDKNSLPVGAITYLTSMLSQHILGWNDDLSTLNVIQKGTLCEDASIQLYNDVHFTDYSKNVERVEKGNLTGECDIIDHEKSLIIDIKTAWSKKTFPVFLDVEDKKDYFWQLVAYMYLYDCNYAELAYCLVDTPTQMIPHHESDILHIVSDIPPAYRVTTARIERDLAVEQQLLNRINSAQTWLNQRLSERGLEIKNA